MGAPRLTEGRKERLREFVRANPGISLRSYASVLGCSVLTLQKVLRESGEDWDWAAEATRRVEAKSGIGPLKARILAEFRLAGVRGLTRAELAHQLGYSSVEFFTQILAEMVKGRLLEIAGLRGGGLGAGSGNRPKRVWALPGFGPVLSEKDSYLEEKIPFLLDKFGSMTCTEIAQKCQRGSREGRRIVQMAVKRLAGGGHLRVAGLRSSGNGGKLVRIWENVRGPMKEIVDD